MNIGIPYSLGETAISGENTHLLGRRAIFDDVDLTSTSGAYGPTTGMQVEAVWVKNDDATALLPGEICSWEAGYAGSRVDDKNAVDTPGAGVVDHNLPAAGVAAGEHFWLITKGPCDVLHAGNDSISAGDLLVTAAVGRVDKYDGTDTSASEANACFGRALESPATTAGLAFRAFVNFTL